MRVDFTKNDFFIQPTMSSNADFRLPRAQGRVACDRLLPGRFSSSSTPNEFLFEGTTLSHVCRFTTRVGLLRRVTFVVVNVDA